MKPKRRRRYRIASGVVQPSPGPFDRVLGLERWGIGRAALAVTLGLGFHLGLLLLARLVPQAPPRIVRREIPVVVASRPPPPPPPVPAPSPPRRVQARRPIRGPRPAAAQASKVIARAVAPAEPLDFTGFDMVTGESTSFAGGFTASNGKSDRAVTDSNASAHGAVGGHRGVHQGSLAKPPGPARQDWACNWPDEAQATDLRDARVGLRVTVDRDGAPTAVQIGSSPAQSFTEAARVCALSEAYRPALDALGRRVGGTTPLFVVHFVR